MKVVDGVNATATEKSSKRHSGSTATRRVYDWNRVRRFLLRYGSLMGLVIITIGFSIIAPNFMTYANVITMLRQMSIVAVIAYGATFVLILGGFDLSVSGIAGLAGSILGILLSRGYGTAFAILSAIGVGVGLGLVNGLIATKLRIGIYLSGLAMSWFGRGLALKITRFEPLYKGMQGNQSFLWFGQGLLGPIPVPFLIAGILFIGLQVFMTNTQIGRNMYTIGGSEEGAAACGINVERYRIMGLCASGVFASIGAILLTSRAGAAIPRAAEGLWLDALLAAVFGTTVITGGTPHILGTGVGVLFTGVLLNGFTQFNVHEFHQMVIKGILLVGAVGLGALGGRILKVDFR